MIKTARQLKELIRNLSTKKYADAQLLMRNYMMERFLERISLSEYAETLGILPQEVFLCGRSGVEHHHGGSPQFIRSL